MKIGEVAKQSGLSAHTIRYYERIGLLPYAFRDQSGRRDYSTDILVWIEFLGRLKATGMTIRNMSRYAELREQGISSEVERRELLVEHRQQVRERALELQNNLLVLDTKISNYTKSINKDDEDDTTACTRRIPVRTRQPRTG